MLRQAVPLVGPLLVGSVLFLALGPLLPSSKGLIEVDVWTVEAIVDERADRLGRELTESERAETIRSHVDQEILVREAYRRGFHLTHPGVRARLLRRMRLALSEGIPEPSRSQLRAYYSSNSERYLIDESVTLAHVFWRADSENRPADPEAPLRALSAGADFRTMGERFWQGPVLPQMTRDALTAALGADFADRAFDLEPRSWVGPLQSSRGIHYVAVVERHAPAIAPFEPLEEYVRADWLTEKRADLMDRRLERMARRYEITIEGLEDGAASEGVADAPGGGDRP